jgi:hypothetical protein
MDLKILNKFHNSLVNFFDELVEMFPNEQEFILLRILIKDQIPSTQIMSYFEFALKNKQIMSSIENRDDNFFLDNLLFSKINKSDIFKKIWINKLNEDDKNIIWKWVDSFMKLTEEYIKHK